jgi:hypothetical protein
MIDISGVVLEATNAIIMVMFFFMLVAASAYFWSRLRAAFEFERKDPFRKVYAESKASFAVTILFAGMFLRQVAVWWPRHVVQHGGHLDWWTAHVFNVVIVAVSIPIIWGSVCWMRVTLPLRCHPWAWAIIAIGAIAFGVLTSAL